MTERTRMRRRIAIAACVSTLLLGACASPGGRAPAIEERHEDGFRIREKVGFAVGLRGDFANARARIEAGEIEAGIALLESVVEAAPQATAAHINLGMAHAKADDLEEAQASLERAVALNPRHPVAHNELGIVRRRLGRFDEARASYERAIALQPTFHYARRNLAILCDLYLRDSTCALENYEAYAEAVPADGQVEIWIADLRNRANVPAAPAP